MESNSIFTQSQSLVEQYLQIADVDWNQLWEATRETLYMTIFTTLSIFILGLILGLLLFETNGTNNTVIDILYYITAGIVNIFRSIPFIILIVLLLPYTRFLLGTMTGPSAALPALIFSTAPFYARLVETGFREVDKGVIEAAEAMGANKLQIIFKVLIPESLPSIVAGLTTTTIAIVGFTAMAGVIGAGGLGNLAYLRGFQRNQPTVVLVATIVILLIVFIIQAIGDILVKKIDKR